MAVPSRSPSATGIGIAPEDQAAIFEEFRQVGREDARKQEGTGLGLTLAKKFVELHGGRIWVESHVGHVAAHGERLDFKAADGHYSQALALASELGMCPLVAHCHLGLGKLYRRTGGHAKASEHLTTASAMYREMDMGFWLEKAETELGGAER
jgi:Histidine kinase-, DNA gyrase B-, and HSP90-like ATPase/Tetratricopeptide repeat